MVVVTTPVAGTRGRRFRRRRPPASGRSSGQGRQALVAWGFALPFVLLFMVFMVGPVIASFAMSFTDMRSGDVKTPFAVSFVGLDNYVQMFGDEQFRRAAVNTGLVVLVGVPLTMGLGLAAAVGLNSGIRRFRTLFRAGYYLPYITSIVAVAVVWRFLLQDRQGIVNTVLGYVGIDGPDWLNSTTWALPSLIAMAAWRSLGFLMVIFLAGLQTIPRQVYEAAEMDGANSWQRFLFITLPMMRPTLLFGGVLTGIGYLQFFEEPFVMTQGGPLDSTLSVSYHLYNQFSFGNYGYATSMGYLLFVAIVVLTVAQFRLLRDKT
jgi:multiple sugar transport system permease protein